MFISRERYLEIFESIDQKLQQLNLNAIGRVRIAKMFDIDETSAKFVKDYYPDIIAVHRIIYSHYGKQYIVWENCNHEKFTSSYSYYNNNYCKNRWKEFKNNMIYGIKKIRYLKNVMCNEI